MDRWCRGSLLAGAWPTALGGVIRLIAQTFLWAMVGQVIIAIAQPLVLNALTKTATGYLPEAERPAGIAVAEMRRVLSVDLIRELAWLAFVGIGVFVALSTWLQPILHNDRISSDAAGAMLAGMLVAGTVGCGLVPPAIARGGIERQYLTFVVLWVGGCCALLAAVQAVLSADVVLMAAIGFVLLAALPVMLELTERTMGASGGVATGILLLAGNAGGLVVAVIVGVLVDTPAAAFLVLAGAAWIGPPAARRLTTQRTQAPTAAQRERPRPARLGGNRRGPADDSAASEGARTFAGDSVSPPGRRLTTVSVVFLALLGAV